ncbi:MAG TPA: DUF2510 domain-containing protein [Pseudolysinimonas sp.]|nr:DUF2510 domain-containing protein [Pseudolysinimonas sp.]
MTDQATRVVSAGWYQDPASSAQVRWWNGIAWTEHVREKPTTSPATKAEGAVGQGGLAVATTHDSSATETTEERVAAVRELEHQFGIGAVENPVVGGGASGTAVAKGMAAGSAAARTAMRASAARGSTGSAWMISLSPLLALVLAIAAAYVYLYLFANPIVFVVAAGIPYLLCVVWALSDGRTLRARGFEPPRPALALLTGLGYLIARRTRVPGSGPIAMLLVVAVLALGSPLAAIGLGQTQGLANALNVQRTISADYISHGKAVFVNCPPFVDAVTVGSLYTCDATTATGVHRTIWVSIDGNGKFSYSFGL